MKHPLWNETMKEAEGLFFPYFEGEFDDYGGEKARLESYIENTDKENILKSLQQINRIIESDMDNSEVESFIDLRLGANWLVADNNYRKWLIDICDYIQRRMTEIEEARPIKDRLYDADMVGLVTLFSEYYSTLLKNLGAEKEEQEILDLFYKDNGEDTINKAINNLTWVIDSDLDDKDVEIFVAEKLKSNLLPQSGEARNWLMKICDYLKNKSS